MIEDRLELTDLVVKLGRWLDDPREDDGLRTVFAKDAVVHAPRGMSTGFDEVLVSARTSSTVDGGRTQHLSTDVLVDVAGDRADVSANLLNIFFRDGQPPHRQAGTRYDFTARRTEEGWRFDGARITPVWSDPVPPGFPPAAA
ncbi:MAG: nuclear transport factor 2 family protein [Actinophytocola sp.]|uniref:nuclear transport factor 2 family protein n=1 Tax=Actinophytocola sp. TaxID=1872138 RepID=UPI0013285F21|nr:nuclear transport factor 2 family protein [Actinophytocola sp.]MPZ80198.1 nuclear transport factor 2 family protein [Actinophytocola sp.]